MSHFAQLDENSVVIQVLVIDPSLTDQEATQWVSDNLEGTWIQTSYNGNQRFNFAGIGMIYDVNRDAFIYPEPVGNLGFDETTCQWIMPKMEMPSE